MELLPHDLNSTECWCQPRVEHQCSRCKLHAPEPSCEHCGGTGWETAFDPTATVVIIHNDVEWM